MVGGRREEIEKGLEEGEGIRKGRPGGGGEYPLSSHHFTKLATFKELKSSPGTLKPIKWSHLTIADKLTIC